MIARTAARQIEGRRKLALDMAHNRLFVTAFAFTLVFLAIGGRVFDLSLLRGNQEPNLSSVAAPTHLVTERADVVDRNGVLLASSLPTVSLYANARDFANAGEHAGHAAKRLTAVFPEMNAEDIRAKLLSRRAFVYLRRNLTPRQQYAVNGLGITGLNFERSERRVYPHGRLISHIIGMTDTDGRGIAGIEAQFDETLRNGNGPLQLAIDIRVQSLVHDELTQAIDAYQAIGGAAMVLDLQGNEILGMVSLPDFDPNRLATAAGDPGFNRATKGVYEMGSTFKLFNTAMALDSGTVGLTSGYDATKPIRVARFIIRDLHGKKRWMSVPEILVYSSNIGSAKIALDVGTERQKDYLARFGLLDRPTLELPEVGAPLTPSPWREINTMTISYGHGIAVSPLQLATGVATLVNGGQHRPATLIKGTTAEPTAKTRVISQRTSQQMRALMRMIVTRGTGGNADVPGYLVGGKTGTAEKQRNGRYQRKSLISSFVAAFPIDAPRFVVLVMLDEPKGNASTHGYATAGWVAAPVVGGIVRRLGPMTGISPRLLDIAPKPGDPLFLPARAFRR